MLVREAETGRVVATLSGHQGGVSGVAFSPDGRRLASGSGDTTVTIWDLRTRHAIRTLRGHEPARH